MLRDEIRSAIRATVQDLIENDSWRNYQGSSSHQLQDCLAKLLQQSHVELCSSGTAALEILLRAAGIGQGDEVLLSAYDYPGNFWAIERVGARPVLVDVAKDSWNIDFDSLEESRSSECKALVVSHLHGLVQPVDRLVRWCEEHGLLMIEDACQSPGAIYLQRPIGSFGHACVLSFGGGKILSAGRGGAWATNSVGLAQKARVAGGAGSGPYAMSELQSAVVLAQIPWLNRINDITRAYFGTLNEFLVSRNVNWIQPTTSSMIAGETLGAYYQAGWIVTESLNEETASAANNRELLIAKLRSGESEQPSLPGPPIGVGFPGFHRRSNRRCRIASTIVNAPSVAERTIVLHHSIALEQLWLPQQLADWVKTCTTHL